MLITSFIVVALFLNVSLTMMQRNDSDEHPFSEVADQAISVFQGASTSLNVSTISVTGVPSENSDIQSFSDPVDDFDTDMFFVLPVDLLKGVLEFLPFTQLCMLKEVSQRFYHITSKFIDYKFKSRNSENTLVFDVPKLYLDFMLVETSNPFRKFIMDILEKQKMTGLSGKSVAHNQRIKFFISALFGGDPVCNFETVKFMDDPLTELVLRFGEFKMHFHYVTPQAIRKYGAEYFEGSVIKNVDNLLIFYLQELFSQDFETRREILKLFTENTFPTFQVLVETEDVFDSRLSADEITIREFFFLCRLAKDEKSCDEAFKLAKPLIMAHDCRLVVHLCIKFGTPFFIVKVLSWAKRTGNNISSCVPFLLNHEDADYVYRSVIEVDQIILSIKMTDEKYAVRDMVECGLMTGLEDELLLPIIEASPILDGVESLIWIAIFRNRSIGLITALKILLPGNLDHLRIQMSLSEIPYTIRLNLNISPERIIELCELSIGTLQSWMDEMPVPASTTYLHHILDNFPAARISADCLGANFLLSSDDQLIKKYIRNLLMYGDSGSYFPDIVLRDFMPEVITIVREALQDGIFPAKMLSINLDDSREKFSNIVFQQVLSLENGFVSMISGQFADVSDLNSIDWSDQRIVLHASAIMMKAISLSIGFDVGELITEEAFKDLIFASLFIMISRLPHDIILSRTFDRNKRKNIANSLISSWKKPFQNVSVCIMRMFSNSQSCVTGEATVQSSFEKVLLEVIMTDGLEGLLDISKLN